MSEHALVLNAGSSSLKFALFETDSYDSRLYAFEQDLIGVYSIPPYSGRGMRWYGMVRVSAFRSMDLWLRYGAWIYQDRNSIGSSLFTQTDASGEPTVGNPGGQEGLGTLMQGYLEQSNVSVVEEFINMIVSQRAYEANSKVVKAADDMYSQVNNLTR